MLLRTRGRNPENSQVKVKQTWWAAIGLILAQYLLLLHGVTAVYFTADEPAYIAGGYALLARGTEALPFLAQRGYPPLLAGAEALFLYADNPHIPVTELAGWPNSFDQFTSAFKPYLAPIERTLFLTRLPTIWLMALLAAVLFRWARSLWGVNGALLALLVLVFDPTLLANGRLAHTDAGIVALGTMALYAVWRWTATKHWHWVIASACLLGLTLLAKVSGVFYVVAAAVGVLVVLLQSAKAKRLTLLIQGLALLGGAGLLFWGGYAFTWGRITNFPLPVPAPAYWQSILYLRHYSSEIFTLGQQWYTALWWYYPVSFAIKNPLLLLAGLLLGAGQLIYAGLQTTGLEIAQKDHSKAQSRQDKTFSFAPLRLGVKSSAFVCRWSQATILWAFPVLYTATALLIGMNIGYRHMLPIHPYLYLLIGGGMAMWAGRGQPWRRGLLLLACLVYAAGTLRSFPRELSFFNSLVGGSANGYRYLSDANVDWGQTPPADIAAYVAENPGIQTAPPATPFRPAPGRYLLTASALRGAGQHDPHAYGWFQQQEPTAVFRDALLVYDVAPFALRWLAQCEKPVPPLDTETILSQTGVADLRVASFDCSQSWLYPTGGSQAGVYAFNYELFSPPTLQLPAFLFGTPTATDPFMAHHLAEARLSFVKTRVDDTQAFVLYEATLSSTPPPYPQNGRFAPVTLSPAAAESLGQWQPSASFNNTLTFLGTAFTPGVSFWEVESWWRVEQGPVERPFSLMAHLVANDGTVVAVADGLGISPLLLRPGDTIVQRHRFPAPPEGQAYWLKTGAYWSDSIEQWPLDNVPDANALFIPLTE